jgi:hypothetical protein
MGEGDDRRLVSVDDFVDENDRGHLPRSLTGWLTTTDHKALGIAYIVTSMVFLAIGGALAGVIRAELAEPGLQIVSEQTYNGVFTIHGSVMVYLFAVPFGFGLANYLVPLQIGAPDLALPRLERAASSTTATQYHSDRCQDRGLEEGSWAVRGVWRSRRTSFRSRFAILEGWHFPNCSECSGALRPA